MENIKILIVDDHLLFTQMTSNYFREQNWVEIVTVVNSGEELLRYIKDEVKFDIILSDLQMTGYDGIKTMQETFKLNQYLKFIVVSQFEYPLKIRKALDTGAKGYVCKSESIEILSKAIEVVLNGGNYNSPLAQKSLNKLQNPVDGNEILSKREMDIIELVIDGLSASEIANTLFLSESTIETHKKHIHKKLGVKNLAELIKKMKELGWG